MKERVFLLILLLALSVAAPLSLPGLGLWVEPWAGYEAAGDFKQGYSVAGDDLLSSARELKFPVKGVSFGGSLGVHFSSFLFGLFARYYPVEYKNPNLLYHPESGIAGVLNFGPVLGCYIPGLPLRVTGTFHASQFNLSNYDGKEGGINYSGYGFSAGLGYFFTLLPGLLRAGLCLNCSWDTVSQYVGMGTKERADLPALTGVSEIKRYDRIRIRHLTVSLCIPVTL